MRRVRQERALGRAAGGAGRGDRRLPASRNPPDPAGWYAQAGAGAAHDALARLGEIARADARRHGTADNVVDPRNAPLLAQRDPGRAARAVRRRRAPALLGASRGVRRARRGVPRDERCTRSTTGSATRARLTPERVAIDYLGRESRTASWTRARTRSRALLARGLQRGDRVATLTGNSPEHVIVFFACAKAGCDAAAAELAARPPELASSSTTPSRRAARRGRVRGARARAGHASASRRRTATALRR